MANCSYFPLYLIWLDTSNEMYSLPRYNLYVCRVQLYKKGRWGLFEDLFYDRLIKLRAEKGVSAREMSLAIGQSPGYINGLENRNGFPSMQVFFYICEYLGVTPSEFFDNGNSYPIEYRRLLKDMDALDEESRRNVLAIVKGLRR